MGTCALVLTFDQPDSLAACLEALAAQTVLPDEVVVTDNHGARPAELVTARFEGVFDSLRVVRTDENLGPAGGHAVGLAAFLEGDAEVAWVLDDDIRPEPECLEALLARHRAQPEAVLFPLQISAAGRGEHYPAWCGVAIPRTGVERVGLPNADLFWWIEDTEYLQWRLRRAGYRNVWVDDAVVFHDEVRRTGTQVPWKTYYEIRNSIYYRTRVQRGTKIWKLGRTLATTASAIARQPEHRSLNARMLLRAMNDGVAGRLGRQVPVPVAVPVPVTVERTTLRPARHLVPAGQV